MVLADRKQFIPNAKCWQSGINARNGIPCNAVQCSKRAMGAAGSSEESREGGLSTESIEIVLTAPTWSWSQHIEKLFSPFLGVFVPKEKKLKTLRGEDPFQLLLGLSA